MSKRLLIINPEQCIEVVIEQQITMGRDVFNSLSLQDPEVSRSHAIIFEQEDEFVIKDLNSRNGIYVRGEKTRESKLAPGDEIIMGSTVMVFDPPDTLDLGVQLSKRGKYLIEKRAKSESKKIPQPTTTFTRQQMDHAIESLLSDPESTRFMTLNQVIVLLQAVKEMGNAKDSQELFEAALRCSMTTLGGQRGIIMETDQTKNKLKVRAIRTQDNRDTLTIAQPVLKAVMGEEKCLYCANTQSDQHFSKMKSQAEPVQSFAACPIICADELFGFIYLDTNQAHPCYDYTALRSLYFIASHIGALLHVRPTHFTQHAHPVQE